MFLNVHYIPKGVPVPSVFAKRHTDNCGKVLKEYQSIPRISVRYSNVSKVFTVPSVIVKGMPRFPVRYSKSTEVYREFR